MLEPLKSWKPVPFSTRLGRVLMIAAAAFGFKAGAADLPKKALDALRAAGIPQASVSAWGQELGAVPPTVAMRGQATRNPAPPIKLRTTYPPLQLLRPAYR